MPGGKKKNIPNNQVLATTKLNEQNRQQKNTKKIKENYSIPKKIKENYSIPIVYSSEQQRLSPTRIKTQLSMYFNSNYP